MEYLEEILLTIANYGFPIVIAVYLLCRMESKMDKLTVSIYELTREISTLK